MSDRVKNWAFGVLTAVTLAILGAAIQTYIEVKMLRHDMNRVEEILDNIVDEVVK